MFGADRFVFYNYSTGSHVTTHLRRYATEGVVSVLPWRVPVAVDVWPPDPKQEPEIHYFGQLAALNDCLYRVMFRARFATILYIYFFKFTLIVVKSRSFCPLKRGFRQW